VPGNVLTFKKDRWQGIGRPIIDIEPVEARYFPRSASHLVICPMAKDGWQARTAAL
jgi:hypothetical protein